MPDLLNKIKKGYYVSFDNQNNTLHKIIDIDYNNKYILIYSEEYGYTTWEKISYIEKIYKIKID